MSFTSTPCACKAGASHWAWGGSPHAMLLAALARAPALLMDFHAHGTPAPGGVESWGEAARHAIALADAATADGTLTDTRDLHWFDWTRCSAASAEGNDLGGVRGTRPLRGTPLLAPIAPWLWLEPVAARGQKTPRWAWARTHCRRSCPPASAAPAKTLRQQ
ncbi:MAG: hypothetical protein IPH54_15410 [Rhodoferax sp.]|nr:hypothetical protein [Rhodoferax sp.]